MVVHKDMPFGDYLAHPAYGSSDLRAFRTGPPAMVPWRRQNREQDTDATRLGSAAHCAILTPDLFAKDYAVKPEGLSFATKEGKEWRATHGGRTIITHDQWLQVRGVHAALCGKLAAFESLHAAVGREWSIFWRCERTGLDCKGRPDWFDERSVSDLKVSVIADRDADSLASAAHRQGWMHQLAHNRAGLQANDYPHVAVGRLVLISPNPPHNVWLLEVCENDMDFLDLDNRNTRLGMAECHRTGNWPGTPDSFRVIELPASAAFTESDIEGALEVSET
jgi:hypothetical protein